MKNVIFIAPPAAGKGTLSSYLEENLGYQHISTGDLLRNVMKTDTDLGRQVAELISSGKFVGDDIILPLFKSELEKIKGLPFILDGMPRNLEQAKFLDNLFQEMHVDNYVVINIAIEKELLSKRATGRRLCESCGASYNIYFDDFKPKAEDTCDKCNNKLIHRTDDTSEVFENRYQIYLENTEPLIQFYKEKGLLKSVDASKSQKEIIESILQILQGETND